MTHQLLAWLLAATQYAHPGPLQETIGAEYVFLTHRTPEDLSRFIVELQQRELALKDKNSSLASR